MIPGDPIIVLLLDDNCRRRGYLSRYLEMRGCHVHAAGLRQCLSESLSRWPDMILIFSRWWLRIARRILANPYLRHVEVYGCA